MYVNTVVCCMWILAHAAETLESGTVIWEY